MASIKAIEAKSVHQIQSGQVIVDLCSVVKELVENSLDAGATTIEVRFKNQGLDLIEVQDNGSGISPSNYNSLALKHYTSKLSTYDDLSTLQTFGFRGEALSSLSALSTFSVTTAQANEAPKGSHLEFDLSGALKNTTTVASQKGTTTTVEGLFERLPVRRKELAKNIKREYGKVLSLLHAYACIGVNVKFAVKNTMPKGKSMVVFSTNGNATAKDNIANIYGAKSLSSLVPLDLELDFEASQSQPFRTGNETTKVVVNGHISRPVFGEGRQIPDRQMFFVNGRPCGLPQMAKAINQVYNSFNVSQSPFIFADFRMDTAAYDVNVSPDKRTILLHDAARLIERLKTCLTELFERQDQTVPQSQLQTPKLPAFKQLSVQRQNLRDPARREELEMSPSLNGNLTAHVEAVDTEPDHHDTPGRLLYQHFSNQTSTRDAKEPDSDKRDAGLQKAREKQATKVARAIAEEGSLRAGFDEYDDVHEDHHKNIQEDDDPENSSLNSPHAIRVRDFNARMAEQAAAKPLPDQMTAAETPTVATTTVIEKDSPGIVQNAFDRMRPKRIQAQIATIEIDGETTTQIFGTWSPKLGDHGRSRSDLEIRNESLDTVRGSAFSQSLRKFGASDVDRATDDDIDDTDDIGGGRSKKSSHSSGDDQDGDRETPDEMSAEATDEEEEKGDDASDDTDSDADYVAEVEKKAEEEARVAELIRAAEESAATPSKESTRRANKALQGGQTKDSTTSLLATVDVTMDELYTLSAALRRAMKEHSENDVGGAEDEPSTSDEETRLSLTVSKSDFATMDIAGQFNLGFVLAVRRSPTSTPKQDTPPDRTIVRAKDELFIIDQHASDEKFNFERLQAETVVGNQRMVRSVSLNLTAVQEEIVLENTTALEKNGFIVEIDTSGASPVGRRVTLLTLPVSKEVVFDTRDLDELVHLLSETPLLGDDSIVPRPARVRKMFAMRACRSSIMIGKTLSKRQMQKVVRNMGTMEKPWNCPHGRPTMRHLSCLNDLTTWEEGEVWGRGEGEGEGERGIGGVRLGGGLWRRYLAE